MPNVPANPSDAVTAREVALMRQLCACQLKLINLQIEMLDLEEEHALASKKDARVRKMH